MLDCRDKGKLVEFIFTCFSKLTLVLKTKYSFSYGTNNVYDENFELLNNLEQIEVMN